jgi:hypothetical protein
MAPMIRVALLYVVVLGKFVGLFLFVLRSQF